MAGTSLLTLLDDIATLLDDVAALTKVATKQTAGVLGDDLALNAEQVTGVHTERELPVVWAVFKGSALNKLIIVPSALAISAFAPWAITPLLMVGGAFLCFEGFEKVAHKLLADSNQAKTEHAVQVAALADPKVDILAFEREKIRGAIRTDVILSAEIVVISLGTVADQSLAMQAGVLAAISALMTVGVYGLVAGIVKLDDAGLALERRSNAAARAIGRMILRAAPYLMKGLSIAGTVAMFLVGGGILVHGIGPLAHFVEAQASLVKVLLQGATGLVAGGLIVGIVTLAKRLRTKPIE